MHKAIRDMLENIPDYKVFMTVDEMDANSKKLAEDYPDAVELIEFGRSTEDHPLYCLKIGDGPKNALAFGLPHPNEPIGAMMLEHLSAELAKSKELRDAIGYTWYIVKAWDADGAKKNEGWYKGPYNLFTYVRNFFRPAGFKQVDWTFPIDYKELHFHDTIPETLAMMKLIDEVKPAFIYSLHNAGFGGTYWYMTDGCPELYENMHAAAVKNGVPLSLGEPESASCETLAPAVYKSLGIKTEYDYLEKYGGVDMKEAVKAIHNGDCSASYAYERYGSFTLITELPYFYDKRIDSTEPSGVTRKQAVLEKLLANEENKKDLFKILDISRQYIAEDNPYWLAIKSFTDNSRGHDATRAMIETNPDYQREATVAELFDNRYVARFYESLLFGLLLRGNELELARMDKSGEKDEAKREALTKAVDESMEGVKRVTDYMEEHMDYTVVPIKKLVAIQLESGMLVAEYLKNKG